MVLALALAPLAHLVGDYPLQSHNRRAWIAREQETIVGDARTVYVLVPRAAFGAA